MIKGISLLNDMLPPGDTEFHESDLQDFNLFLGPAGRQCIVVETAGVGNLGDIVDDGWRHSRHVY